MEAQETDWPMVAEGKYEMGFMFAELYESKGSSVWIKVKLKDPKTNTLVLVTLLAANRPQWLPALGSYGKDLDLVPNLKELVKWIRNYIAKDSKLNVEVFHRKGLDHIIYLDPRIMLKEGNEND